MVFDLIKNFFETCRHPRFIGFLLFFISGILACSLCLSLAPIDISSLQRDYTQSNLLMQFMMILTGAIERSFPFEISTFLLAATTLTLFVALPTKQKRSYLLAFLSLFFAAFTCLGRLVNDGATSSFGLSVMMRALIYLAAFACLCYMSLIILDFALQAYRQHSQNRKASLDLRENVKQIKPTTNNSKKCPHSLTLKKSISKETASGFFSKLSRLLFKEKTWLAPFILILLTWLPYIVATFPGTMDPYDVLDQLTQYHGIAFRTPEWINLVDPNILLNNNNPVFHTVLLNLCVDAGTALGNQNLGFFAFLTMQILLFAGALAASIRCLAIWLKAPRFFLAATLLIFCFVPLFPAWAITVTKDVPFSALILFYFTYLIRLVVHPEDFSKHRRLYLELFIIIILLELVRANGMHVVLLTTPFLLMLRNRNARFTVGVSVAGVLCFVLYSNLLLPALGVSGGSPKEMFSVPFQQTALYLREHPNDVTEAERNAIASLLPYGEIATVYDSGKADNVKDRYNKDATSSDILAYFKAWAQMGTRHPEIYGIATAMNVRAYFDPGENTSWAWFDIYVAGQNGQHSLEKQYNEAGFFFSQVDELQPVRDVLSQGFKLYHKTPFSLLTNMGFASWVLLFCSAYLLKHLQWRYLVPLIPALLLLLVCILSPINGSIRYALPYVVATPLLVGYTLWCIRFGNLSSKQTYRAFI